LIKNAAILLLLLFHLLPSYGQELCDNAIDDDGDGLIDLNDDDCDCNNLIDHSIIPNPSFEIIDCCPDAEGMMSCATAWNQASAATSDFYHTCGFSEFGIDGALPPTFPLPGGGDGFIGLYNFLSGYREYAGSCLLTNLLAGVSYSLNFHMAYSYGDLEEIEVRLFGSPNCTDLPWFGISCPDGIASWELLGAETVVTGTDGEWVSVTIEFIPITNIDAIAIGMPCGDLGGAEGSYYYFDELILLETEVMGYITQTGGWCSGDLVLTANNDELDGIWQWYKDGIALLGEFGSTLSPIPYGEGTFTAVFTYLDGCKQVDYESPSMPVAEFTSDNVCYGDPVFFTNLSSTPGGGIDAWEWNFGDDIASNDFSPSHLYPTAGLYEVELIVYSDDPSCNDTAFAEVSILAKPEPAFEISGTGVSYAGDWFGCYGHELTFTDLTTIDGPISFASWAWDFGDGGAATEQNPTHTYDGPGEFDIKLVVVSENGCIDSTHNPIILNGVVANFVTDSVCENEIITFENTSYSTEGGLTLTRWYFGDDTDTSYLENPTHLYPSGGSYDALLYVENAQGCYDSILQTVIIFNTPSTDFYASQNPTDYFNTDLELIMIYPDPTSSYLWQMPGGAPSSSTSYGSVEVVYPQFIAADYEVQLIETSVNGCSDTAVHIISVLEDEMIFAPNAFTPNGDPFNPDWGVYVEGFNLDEFRLELYNRWGEVVWQTDNPTDRWDGTYLDGTLVQSGVYVWHIKARDQINDKVFEYHGMVSVLR
jgi:gliding motility-associated-like protein